MEIESIKPAMSQNEIAWKLKSQADKDPSFRTICHIFAKRLRTRQQITTANLKQTVVKKGFNLSNDDCEKALAFMANLGIGALQRDIKGRVKALKGINFTLQSIGAASINESNKLEKFHPNPHFTKLLANKAKDFVDLPEKDFIESDPKQVNLVNLIIKVNYKTFTFEKFSEENLTKIVDYVDKLYRGQQ